MALRAMVALRVRVGADAVPVVPRDVLIGATALRVMIAPRVFVPVRAVTFCGFCGVAPRVGAETVSLGDVMVRDCMFVVWRADTFLDSCFCGAPRLVVPADVFVRLRDVVPVGRELAVDCVVAGVLCRLLDMVPDVPRRAVAARAISAASSATAA